MYEEKAYPIQKYLSEKLSGREMIRSFFGWSIDKYKRKLVELQKSGVLNYEWQGQPPRKVPCVMIRTALVWLSLKAVKGECV